MNSRRNVNNKGYIIGITTLSGMGMLGNILKKGIELTSNKFDIIVK